MADQWEPRNLPLLAGYESWLYQMACADSAGDVFVSKLLPGRSGLSAESPTRWLVSVGDIGGPREDRPPLKGHLQAEIGRLAITIFNPAAILESLNDHFLRPDTFACLLVALIDSDRHVMTFANAGHLSPLLRRVDRQTELIGAESAGLPLWIVPGQQYENIELPIRPGEVVVFYTDGVTEVMDNQHTLFSLDRLQRSTSQARAETGSVARSILEAIRLFGQGQAHFDDITLLCFARATPKVTPDNRA
jgi:phosphoserine phosphatase RsbU/P